MRKLLFKLTKVSERERMKKKRKNSLYNNELRRKNKKNK